MWLDAGATLVGSKDLTQYMSAVEHENWYRALVLAKGAKHVAVMGRGVIDGNQVRDPNGEERIRGPHAVLLYDTEDATVRDVSIQDAGNYALIVRSSQGINIDGIVVHGGWDGINMHDVRNATIANSRLFTGDDSLAGSFWENVTVTNCILNASANAIRVGGRNVLFSNLMIYGPGESRHLTSLRTQLEAGFQILPNRAGARHKFTAELPVDNMVLSNVTMVNVGTPVYVAYSEDAPYTTNTLGVGRIIINDMTVLGAGLTPFYISAPATNPAQSIVLNHVRMQFAGGARESHAEGQGFSPFSVLQSYAIYARHVQNLELHDVHVDFKETDLRPAIFGDHVAKVELDSVHATRAPAGAPSLQFDEFGSLIVDGKPQVASELQAAGLSVPSAAVDAQDRFQAVVAVESAKSAGLNEVTLRVGEKTIRRSVWLEKGEQADLSFLNLTNDSPGLLAVEAGSIRKTVLIVGSRSNQTVDPPYLTFHNVTAEVRRGADEFYLRAGGDYPVMEYADQYGAIYLQRKLPENGTVLVRLENPDGATNWLGRAGLMVRNDIAKP
ncbi:MAG: glycosyl hydrolase family 28 protein, partial [Terriglobales bacterium]